MCLWVDFFQKCIEHKLNLRIILLSKFSFFNLLIFIHPFFISLLSKESKYQLCLEAFRWKDYL